MNRKINRSGSFTLKIRYLGLFGFVQSAQKGGTMRVLGVDARAPGIATDGTKHVSHHSYLSFNIDDLASDRDQPFFYYHRSADDERTQGRWFLNNDDIEIRVDGQPLPVGNLSVIEKGDERKFSLIPSMRDFYPELNGLKAKESCLTNSEPNSCGLTMRMKLESGSIGVYPGENGEYISIDEYALAPSLKKRRIAACAEYRVEIEGDEAEIRSRQLGSGFVFRPVGGRDLELTIANVPPEGVEAARPFNPDKDIDFELIYSIAEVMPVQLRVPTRSGISPELPRPLFCGGARFNKI